MYLHIGKGLSLNDSDILAIFDINYIKNNKEYKNFYEKIKNEKNIIDISEGKEKSLILTDKKGCTKAYISNINAKTIGKRNF